MLCCKSCIVLVILILIFLYKWFWSWFQITFRWVIFDFDFKSLSWVWFWFLIWNHFISDLSQHCPIPNPGIEKTGLALESLVGIVQCAIVHAGVISNCAMFPFDDFLFYSGDIHDTSCEIDEILIFQNPSCWGLSPQISDRILSIWVNMWQSLTTTEQGTSEIKRRNKKI